MEKSSYEWVKGYGAKISADVAHKELERIRDENDGELTADLVVNAAKDKGSPLNPQVFDKGVKAAATEYYKSNARKMIRSIVIVRPEMPEVKPRAYSVVREEPSAVVASRKASIYSSTEDALQDPEYRQYVLASALRDAASWRKKYAALSELAKIFTAIDEVASKAL